MPAEVQLNAWVMEDTWAAKTQKSSAAKHLPITQTQSRLLRELQFHFDVVKVKEHGWHGRVPGVLLGGRSGCISSV